MSVVVQLQSIPETCELLELARKDYTVIAWLWSFERILTRGSCYPKEQETEKRNKLDKLALKCIRSNPRIEERNFWGNKKHDSILYLLSPQRRNSEFQDDSLFNIAIHGEVKLNPNEHTGYISPKTVESIADYMAGITLDEMKKHYDYERMNDARVTKLGSATNTLDGSWREFQEMREIYLQASKYQEAMLTRIE